MAEKKKIGSSKATAGVKKVALLGFGTVGSSVAELMQMRKLPGIELGYVFNRNVAGKLAGKAAQRVPASVEWTEKIEDVLGSDADIIVELMGGIDPAGKWIRRALASGKSVVTANKQLIAYEGASLLRLAAKNGAHLLYGAAVAGGVPVIPGVLQGLSGDSLKRVSGILNGTCNFILSQMETGADYAEVLAEAQRLGYAEADPTADVDGFDARAKLVILTRIALGAEINPDAVAAESIRRIAAIDFSYTREMGCTIRQISRAEIDGAVVRARVAPMVVPRSLAIAGSHGTLNTVVTNGRFGGDVVFSGHGAGGRPTAVAVVSDILAAAQGSGQVALPVRKRQVTGEMVAPHYLRFVVNDKPGIVSGIAGILAKHKINLDSILQRQGYPKERLPFIATVEPCLNTTLKKVVAAIGRMDSMLEAPLCLQILPVEDKDV
jgi:homoserine dehydrogenase